MKLNKIAAIAALSMVVYLPVASFANLAQTKESDTRIVSNIQNEIESDSTLKGAQIQIVSTDGDVELMGNVTSDAQAERVTEIAQATPGVKDINTSKIMVNGSQHPVDDSMITAKIKGKYLQKKLFADKDVAAFTITVETTDGIVTLSGKADNQEQINNAIKIAKSVHGVKQVKSDVIVSK